MASNIPTRNRRKQGGLCSCCGHISVSGSKYKQCAECRDRRARKAAANDAARAKLQESTDPVSDLWQGPEWIFKEEEETPSAWSNHKSKIRPPRANAGRKTYPGLNTLATVNGKASQWTPKLSNKIT